MLAENFRYDYDKFSQSIRMRLEQVQTSIVKLTSEVHKYSIGVQSRQVVDEKSDKAAREIIE